MAYTDVGGKYNATPPTLVDGQSAELQVDSAGNLKVALATGDTDQDVNVVKIGGTAVTAGAGAVTAGTQRVTHASDDPVTTSVQIMDDWDESDRAKVNLIVGQAGIAAGAGNVGATVPRVTLATDDAMSAKLPASLGAKAPSASLSVTPAGYAYETVAASQTDQVLGATGGTGDYLSHIVIQPTTTGAGMVTVKDGTTVIFTFTTGTLADLSPKTVPFGIVSVNGSWKVTTGANVAVIGVGTFAA